MTEPLVSICIPVYNRQRTVARAIDSAVAQSYSSLEIICVDNASSDATYATLQRYQASHQNVRVFRNEKNLGPVANWLRCVEESRGEFIKILFSDDWLLPGAISSFVEGFRQCEEAAFVICVVGFVLGGRQFPGSYSRGKSGPVSTREYLWHQLTAPEPLVSPSAAMFRREDALRFISLDISGPDGTYCNCRGMGNDLMIFLRPADSRRFFYHVEEKLVVFSDSDEEESISKAANETGLSHRRVSCYRNALSYFLLTSRLSPFERAELRTAMFLRELTISNLSSPKLRTELFQRLGSFGWALLALITIPNLTRDRESATRGSC